VALTSGPGFIVFRVVASRTLPLLPRGAFAKMELSSLPDNEGANRNALESESGPD
jgi:hypothetical protein